MNQDIGTDNSVNHADPHAAEPGYQLAVRVAVVAGIFSAVVGAALLIDFGRRGAEDPLEYPKIHQLKAQLAQRPQDEGIKQQIRALDLELRKAYFRQRRFTAAGSWLLRCWVVVFLVASKWAATLRQKLPMPEPQLMSRDTETKMAQIARWSVAVLAMALVAAAVLLSRSFQSELSQTAEPVAAVAESPSAPPELPAGTGEPAASGELSGFPSDEEIRANWPRFRGPGGQGISSHRGVPTHWDGASGEAVLWKTPVPLEGNNSPVLWNNRVFLSGATEAKREVYCFDADNGKLLWQADVPGSPQAPAEPPKVTEDTGYAAPTTTTDGRRVYAMFATGDVAAFDFTGRQVWARSLGVPDNSYGYASSLTMYRNLLLIQFDQGSAKDDQSKMLALDGATGKTVWEAAREVANSWPTPIVIEMPDGTKQLITCSDPWVIAYDPADGREIWRSKSLEGDVGPSPAFADGIVYVASEFPGLSAIRADGKGDVTDTHVVWEGEDGLPDTASPLATPQYVFVAASYGILTCYEAKRGEFLWEEEFERAAFTSSPSLVEGRLYLFDVDGKAWVVEPGPEGCKRIGEADLGEGCVTSPAFRDGRLYIRGKKHLFCIGAR